MLARLSIPRLSRVEDLTEAHVAALTAFLSSTTISELPPRTPVVDPSGERELLAGEAADQLSDKRRAEADWGRKMLIENELRGKINTDIRTLIDIGTWRGRRCVVCLVARSWPELVSVDADPASPSRARSVLTGTGRTSRSRLARSITLRRRFGSTSPAGTSRRASLMYTRGLPVKRTLTSSRMPALA